MAGHPGLAAKSVVGLTTKRIPSGSGEAVMPTTGLVLGGGTAKGSFQAGAIRYLYEYQDFDPHIICGSSVGALMGLKLAEGGDVGATAADLWRSLRGPGDVYALNPDLVRGLDKIEEWIESKVEDLATYANGVRRLVHSWDSCSVERSALG